MEDIKFIDLSEDRIRGIVPFNPIKKVVINCESVVLRVKGCDSPFCSIELGKGSYDFTVFEVIEINGVEFRRVQS